MLVAMSISMFDTTQKSNSALLLSQGRCSEEVRTLATNRGWPILEGVDSTQGLHACVAMEPRAVCVEYTDSINSVPDLISRLSALNSIVRVACLVPKITMTLERSLASLGVQALSGKAEIDDWMLAGTHPMCANRKRFTHDEQEFARSPKVERVSRRIHMIPKGPKYGFIDRRAGAG